MECDCLTFRREKLFPCEWWCKWRNIEKEEKTSGESTLKWQWKIARITLNKFEIYANGIRCWLLEQVKKSVIKCESNFLFDSTARKIKIGYLLCHCLVAIRRKCWFDASHLYFLAKVSFHNFSGEFAFAMRRFKKHGLLRIMCTAVHIFFTLWERIFV